MVIIKEYIIPLPISVDEYHIGQLWLDSEIRKREKNAEFVINESYMLDGIEGLHTKKLTRNDSRVPSFVRFVAPSGSLDVYEEVWNNHPKGRALISNGYLKEKFHISMKMMHVPDDLGSSINVHQHSNYDAIEKVIIDIANDPLKCKPELNPKLFVSKKTGRGKLGANWIDDFKGQGDNNVSKMCCYILAEVKLQIPAMQNKIENMIQTSVRNILTERQREIFCGIDVWFDLNVDDIPKVGG